MKFFGPVYINGSLINDSYLSLKDSALLKEFGLESGLVTFEVQGKAPKVGRSY